MYGRLRLRLVGVLSLLLLLLVVVSDAWSVSLIRTKRYSTNTLPLLLPPIDQHWMYHRFRRIVTTTTTIPGSLKMSTNKDECETLVGLVDAFTNNHNKRTTKDRVPTPNSRSTKFHHWTVCMVPPEQSSHTWQSLSKARTQLQDPGLYRWPPHANLLYPFVNAWATTTTQTTITTMTNHNHHTTNQESEPVRDRPGSTLDIDASILQKLRKACQQCDPFRVRLQRFGTFGGAKRGVLWLYPESYPCHHNNDNNNNNHQGDKEMSTMEVDDSISPNDTHAITKQTVEPLIQLQKYLEDAFPICSDQRKVSGTFNPHMTLSHFVNLHAAQEAQATVESWWPSDIMFEVDRIYLLHRQGDAGQFLIVAEILLGSIEADNGTEIPGVILHKPPRPFVHMPDTEVDWVREARMQLKKRRNGGRRGGRGRRRSGPRIPDTPEEIAAKRAARKAKREAAAQAQESEASE